MNDLFMRDNLISLKLNTNIVSPYGTMLWYHLEDLNSAECGLFLWAFLLVIHRGVDHAGEASPPHTHTHLI